MGQSLHSLGELLVAYTTSIPSNFLVAPDSLLYLKSLFINSVTYQLYNSIGCLCTLTCIFAHLIVNSEIFVVSSGFHKVITCISWAALIETRCGQHSFHCITCTAGNQIALTDSFAILGKCVSDLF